MKRLTLLLGCLFSLSCYAQEVLLVHDFTDQKHPEELFDPSSPYRLLQEALYKNHIQLSCLQKETSPLYATKEQKHSWQKKMQEFFVGEETSLSFSDDPRAYLVFWNIPDDLSLKQIKKIPSDRLILFTFEPPVVFPRQYLPKTTELFSKVYTWNDDLVDDKKFFKFFYPALKQICSSLPSFSERKLCTLVAGNTSSKEPFELYSAHREAIYFFESYAPTDFSFYGPGWNTAEHPTYKGVCKDKIDTLKQYRFSICYEAMHNVKGYITEKIFDCFSAGCIPIYWGASNISTYIPKHCYIDSRHFKSYADLYQFIKNMNEETYNAYVNNIRAFLQSKEAKFFTMEHFAKTFSEAVQD